MYIVSIQCPKTVVSNSSIVTFLLGGRYEISYARMTVKTTDMMSMLHREECLCA